MCPNVPKRRCRHAWAERRCGSVDNAAVGRYQKHSVIGLSTKRVADSDDGGGDDDADDDDDDDDDDHDVHHDHDDDDNDDDNDDDDDDDDDDW